MNKLLTSMLLLSLVLAISGCGGLTSYTKEHTWINGHPYESEKLKYDAKRRVWLYDNEALVFNAKKVTQKELAEELLQVHARLPRSPSTAHTVSTVSAGVVMTPFLLFVGGGVFLASPFIATADTAARHYSFERFVAGEKLLAEGQYEGARQMFHEASTFQPILVYGSDLLYKIAETYEFEGKTVLADAYYRDFLDCSVDLYPREFEEYDKKYVNDLDQLSKELSRAEDKVARGVRE